MFLSFHQVRHRIFSLPSPTAAAATEATAAASKPPARIPSSAGPASRPAVFSPVPKAALPRHVPGGKLMGKSYSELENMNEYDISISETGWTWLSSCQILGIMNRRPNWRSHIFQRGWNHQPGNLGLFYWVEPCFLCQRLGLLNVNGLLSRFFEGWIVESPYLMVGSLCFNLHHWLKSLDVHDWLVVWNMFFHKKWEFHNPNWLSLIFFWSGRSTTSQMIFHGWNQHIFPMNQWTYHFQAIFCGDIPLHRP